MKYFLSAFVTLLFANFSIAQEEQDFEIDHVIKSDAFGDDRKITVYLPPSYYRYEDVKYTVTYVLDGHYDPFIDLVVKNIEYGTNNAKYTPTIVVGIHAKQRGWEFSFPEISDEDDENYEGGRGPQLQEHFREEVFPLVESQYPRTLPFRNIVGHSSGGGFVLHTLFSEQKDLFDGYIGISPALRPGEHTVYSDSRARLASGETFSKFVYCSTGTLGEREVLFGSALDSLEMILETHPDHGMKWNRKTFGETGHWTCVSPSIGDAMVQLTRSYRVDEKLFYDFAANANVSISEQVDEFYANVEKEFGFKDLPSPGYLHGIAIDLRDRKMFKQAMEIYEWGVQQYPENYTLRKSLGKGVAEGIFEEEDIGDRGVSNYEKYILSIMLWLFVF